MSIDIHYFTHTPHQAGTYLVRLRQNTFEVKRRKVYWMLGQYRDGDWFTEFTKTPERWEDHGYVVTGWRYA